MYVVFRYLVHHILAWSMEGGCYNSKIVSRVCHVSSLVLVLIKTNHDKEPNFIHSYSYQIELQMSNILPS